MTYDFALVMVMTFDFVSVTHPDSDFTLSDFLSCFSIPLSSFHLTPSSLLRLGISSLDYAFSLGAFTSDYMILLYAG
jgi:hypothetical protein